MRKLLGILALLATIPSAHAEEVFRIEIGKDYKSYSSSDLQRRVWELERAVWQLQQRVFQLESKKPESNEGWLCTVKAIGNTYTGTASSKAVAKSKAIEACKAGNNGDGFFCNSQVSCEQ